MCDIIIILGSFLEEWRIDNMFKEKIDYIIELLETIVYASSEEGIIEKKENDITYSDIKKVLFGLDERTYKNYRNKESSIESILAKLRRVKFDKETINNYNPDIMVNENDLLDKLKKILLEYKNDFGFNSINIEKIKNMNKIVDLYLYIFDSAYDDNVKLLVLNVNTDNLAIILANKLEVWKKKHPCVSNIGDIIKANTTSCGFIKFRIEYNFAVPGKRDNYLLDVYVYTGVNLNNDLAAEFKNDIFISKNSHNLSLLCIFNPYYNWVKSEDLISNNIYATYLKEHDYSFHVIEEFINLENIREDIVLLNQVSQAILNKVEKYHDIVLKRYLYDNNNLSMKIANMNLLNFQFNLVTEMVKESSSTNILLLGEYTISSIEAYTKYFDNVYVFSNSEEYIRKISILWDRKKEINKGFNACCYYLGIADSIVSKYNNYFDIIVVGNGNGSFYSNLKKHLTYFNYMLTNNGKILFSVYNSEFDCNNLTNNILQSKLDYTVIDDKAFYKLDGANKDFVLKCQNYNLKYIKKYLERFFKVNKVISYPFFSFITDSSSLDISDELSLFIENAIAYNAENIDSRVQGYFLNIIAEKEINNINESQFKNIPMLKHKPIFNKTVQKNYLIEEMKKRDEEISEKNILKVVLFKNNADHEKKAILVTYYGKYLSESNNGSVILSNQEYNFLTIKEINQLGIDAVNISPFILAEDSSVKRYYDIKLNLYVKYYKNLRKEDQINVYFGNGTCENTCYMNICEFVNLLNDSGFESTTVK